MKWFKQAFAPALASLGAIAYLKGNYVKAASRIEASIRWLPQILESPEFIGFLSLSLIKTGRINDAQPYLKMALDNLNKSEPTDKEEIELKEQLLHDIKNALQKNT